MILKLIAPGPSAWDGTAGTQSGVATYDHMRTDYYGSTPWAEGVFRQGLNRWMGSSFFVSTSSPSTATFKDILRVDIQNNQTGFGVSTVEWAGGSHYNAHPVGQQIGHWIVASGFSNSGSNTRFHDPATSVWGGVSPTFNPNTGTFVSTYVQQNGVTW